MAKPGKTQNSHLYENNIVIYGTDFIHNIDIGGLPMPIRRRFKMLRCHM